MVCFEDHMPVMAMLAMQLAISGVPIVVRAALLQGMNARVHIEDITVGQNMYIQGLYLTTSSIASAMNNLVPAITFLMAAFARLEKIDISFRSIAKIIGTVVCVIGAASIALLKGPKLLNSEIRAPKPNMILHSGMENWIMGCLLLFGSTCCSSLWFIMQVPIVASYPKQLSLSAWICFLSTVQSAIVTLFLEQDPKTWNFHSPLELWSCLYAGILGSSVSFFVNAWCISQRGPLFCAMFNPLNTVIVLIIGCLFLNEELYTGSLVGSIMVVIGLYIVLWGKAKDTKDIEGDKNTDPRIDSGGTAEVVTVESPEKSCKTDNTEPHSGERL
ncbi:hypothetical protein HHK36_025994 [Tetracentron sinense]|uniref:WAT1-related protein n=1 Tax=Tetracentron sinense TaxID=13715 RepID=A0A834YPC1_TETSI|nr:hypothetical protein HHK36_025994 [Tetracentron sinense]